MTKKQNFTIDDIAQALEISKTTVSRAISGKGRISAATRARVMDYVDVCNYRPSAAAKSLAERRTRTIMLVLPATDSSDTRKIVRDVWCTATEQAYDTLLCFATETGKRALICALDNRKVDGVILAVQDETFADIIRQQQVPFASPSGCRELLMELQSR